MLLANQKPDLRGFSSRGVSVYKNLQTSAKNVHKLEKCPLGEFFPRTHFGKLCYVHPNGPTQRFALCTALWAVYFAKIHVGHQLNPLDQRL